MNQPVPPSDVPPYEFLNTVSTMSDAESQHLHELITQQLNKLCKGHRDITDAAVALEPLSQGQSMHAFRGRVVLYMRPENIAGTAEHETPHIALRNAWRAVERQVREVRDKLRQRTQPT